MKSYIGQFKALKSVLLNGGVIRMLNLIDMQGLKGAFVFEMLRR
jgi:hypothetical protein